MADLGHSIKVVARITGLSTHVIRVWEKRYGAVQPSRTGTNRRLYSSEEVERLTLLRQATTAGHSISNIARLPLEDLRRLVGAVSNSVTTNGHAHIVSLEPQSSSPDRCAQFVAEAMAAVSNLEGDTLDRVLSRASVELIQPVLLQDVLVPLIHRIGELWQRGQLKVAHEHVATAAIRTFVGNFARQNAPANFAPTVAVTTPAGQLHELGAILVAAAASNHGWRVSYLGPSLPAAEIAAAVLQNKARVVALSIVYPEDDPHLENELILLRKLLPENVSILVGGRASKAYPEALRKINARICSSIGDVSSALASLRSAQPVERS